MRYLKPRLEVVGKRPVWSVENLLVTSICLRKTVCVLVIGFDGVASASFGVDGVVVVFVVDLMPCLTSRMCPRAVGLNFGRCLRTRPDVRTDQVANRPASMASIQSECTGLKSTFCRYFASFRIVDCVYALYASSMGSGSCWRMEVLAAR